MTTIGSDPGPDAPNGLQTEWPTEPAGPPRKGDPPFGFMRELPVLLLIAFALALLMKTFLIQAFFIPSESMEPTLHGCSGCEGDRVLVNKLAYRFREPYRGEVIVFIAERDTEPKSTLERIRSFLFEGLGVTRPKEQDFIKRIVGLPGDTIEVIENRGVFITPPGGKRFRLIEPYIKRVDHPNTDTRTCDNLQPSECAQGPGHQRLKIPEGHYFVMGDNRANSADSRVRGPVARVDIIGKAFVKIWPPKRMGILHVPRYCNDPRSSHEDCPSPRAAGAPGMPAPLRAVVAAPFPFLFLALAGGRLALRRRAHRR